MGWAAVLRFVSMIKSFQPAQPGSFQWVDSTKATKKPSIHVARLALLTVRLHRYYKLLLWPINGSTRAFIHVGATLPLWGAKAAGSPQVTVNHWGLPAGVSIVTCSGTRVGPRAPGRLADQGAPCSKGHSSDKVSHDVNLLALLWRSRMVFLPARSYISSQYIIHQIRVYCWAKFLCADESLAS